MFDAIVFGQSGLDTAIDKGVSRILLCGGNFDLPDNIDVTYTPVGKNTAILEVKGANKIISAPTSFASSYRFGSLASSYRTSYTTSFLTSYTTSFLTSYFYRYRYEYRTSFSGSYRTSYRYRASFASSFGSFKLTSFIGSFRRRVYDRVLKEISVNGYGIHLI